MTFNSAITDGSWPEADKKYLVAEEIEIAIQENGKTRQIIKIKADAGQDEVEKIALADIKVKNALAGNEPKKTIFIPGRIINFVI
jgi:leucyl-tRNA synthetase